MGCSRGKGSGRCGPMSACDVLRERNVGSHKDGLNIASFEC